MRWPSIPLTLRMLKNDCLRYVDWRVSIRFSPDAVPQLAQDLRTKLDRLDQSDADLADLRAVVSAAEAAYEAARSPFDTGAENGCGNA